jgi:hypothetical protein
MVSGGRADLALGQCSDLALPDEQDAMRARDPGGAGGNNFVDGLPAPDLLSW